MTLSLLTRTTYVEPARIEAQVGQSVSQRRDWQVWSMLVAALVAIYGLLHNPYWVPGGDSELYLAIARNLVMGRGYVFNGQPVGMVPPGWPLLLAGAMKISDAFWFLKLVPMLSMIGFWAIAYWILRRLTTPHRSAIVILSCALLSYAVPLTYWFHTDAFFALLSAAILLLAFQIYEKSSGFAWRLTLLLLLCAAAMTVRWNGLLAWGLAAAVLLHGQLWPRVNRQWAAVALSALVTFGAFVGLRQELKRNTQALPQVTDVAPAPSTPVEEPLAAAKTVPDPESSAEPAPIPESAGSAPALEPAAPPPLAEERTSRHYSLIVSASQPREYLDRAVASGQWFSWLFWQPLRVGQASPAIAHVATVIGWVVILLLAIAAIPAVRRRQWIWLGLLIYCGALCLNWGAINARYFVPVSFLIFLGVLIGIDHLRARLEARWWQRLCGTMAGLFIASVVLCNLALYAVDAYVARSSDFYAAYEAGLNKDLIAAAWYLNQQPVGDGQIAVSSRYSNMGRSYGNWHGMQVAAVLTDRAILTVPRAQSRAPESKDHPAEWLQTHQVRYYLYQPPIYPWRLWHFRLPYSSDFPDNEPRVDDDSVWRLYEIRDGQARRIKLPEIERWPRRVPVFAPPLGMEPQMEAAAR